MSTRRKLIATGGVATAVIATAVLATLIMGGGKTVHHNTSLDASAKSTLPGDWRRGYSRTGEVCYPQDATGTSATCFAANAVPYGRDATDLGWPVETSAQNNRWPTNEGGACGGAPWVCSTATMDSTTVAPSGEANASTITMGGGSLDATAFGFTNSAKVDLRMYVKCSSGTLDASHVNVAGGIGHWSINCTTVGGNWRLIEPGDSAVTESEAWVADSSGYVTIRLSAADASIWQITATEAVAATYAKSTRLLATIPTSDATGTTLGATTWTVNNALGSYWAASGVTKVETKTAHSGTCWSYSGTTITLSGCHGIWYALSLTWSY